MKKPRIKRVLYELFGLLLALVVLGALLFDIGCWCMPVRTTYGAVWTSYLQEPENSIDVIFLGSSRIYCNVIPAEIYARTGITSYVMAGPSQPMPTTYYYLRQALKTQHPKYVFLELSGAYYRNDEGHSKSNILYMPAGINRILAASTCEKGILGLALYPLQEFHYRIYERPREKPPAYDGFMLAGYTPLDEIKAVEESVRDSSITAENPHYIRNLGYISKIAELCREEGIELRCFFAPIAKTFTEDEKALLFHDLETLGIAPPEDWSGLRAEAGINNATDWLDELHFNRSGATKFSSFFSQYLLGLGLEPTPGANRELWESRIEYVRKK